jgi:pimeloyl-ACP methyl ester carboxylesterase
VLATSLLGPLATALPGGATAQTSAATTQTSSRLEEHNDRHDDRRELQCVDSWVEDFRQDIANNTVPTLIIHGDADRILPPDATSRRQVELIKGATLAEIAGGPHGLCWTHADRVNTALVPFVG